MIDDDLKDQRKQLELAINEALTDSLPVSEAIQRIRSRGYDVFLIIEATIGMSRAEGADADGPSLTSTQLKLTSQDERFLRSLKINPE
jgi:hypothetical protein